MTCELFEISPTISDQHKGLFLFSLLILCFLGIQYGTTFCDSNRWPKPLLSDQKITIELTGEVYRPGLFTYTQRPTIQQVIRDGGGAVFNRSLSRPEKTMVLIQDTSLSFYHNEAGEVFLQPGPLSIKALWILGRPIPLNRAATEDLDRLPGIGPGLARRIVAYRETRGNFSSLDELKEVSGIKEKTFDKIKGYLTL